MVRDRVFLLLIAIFVSQSATAGQQESSNPVAASAATSSAAVTTSGEPTAPAESTKMICRQTAPIGTRIAKKTCKTEAQWEEIRRMGSDAAREGAEKGRVCGENCSAPGG
jgi:guanyl-specific ribonuclease Sa